MAEKSRTSSAQLLRKLSSVTKDQKVADEVTRNIRKTDFFSGKLQKTKFGFKNFWKTSKTIFSKLFCKTSNSAEKHKHCFLFSQNHCQSEQELGGWYRLVPPGRCRTNCFVDSCCQSSTHLRTKCFSKSPQNLTFFQSRWDEDSEN